MNSAKSPPVGGDEEATAASAPEGGLAVTCATGEPLAVQRFEITERISGLYRVRVVASSPDPDLTLEAVVGQPAAFTMAAPGGARRAWPGVCREIRQLAAPRGGLSTYELTLVPALWRAGQRRGQHAFEGLTPIEVAIRILEEWDIAPELRLAGTYAPIARCTQGDESDYAFLARVLSDAGVSFHFDAEGGLVLDDAPHRCPPRAPLQAGPEPGEGERAEAIRVTRRLQRIAGGVGARGRLEAARVWSRTIDFETNAIDVAPGVVVGFLGHPHRELAPGRRLLVVASRRAGVAGGRWTTACTAVSAEQPFRLRPRAPRRRDREEPAAGRVEGDHDLVVTRDRSTTVGANEREITGQDRSITVGGRRTAEVGTVDAISVGEGFVVEVIPPEEGGAGAVLRLEGAELRIEADVIRLVARKRLELEAAGEDVTPRPKSRGDG